MRQAPEWADSTIVRPKFDRNNVEIPRYASIERDFSTSAQSIVGEFQRGNITRRTAYSLFKESLQEAETSAFVAGRRARGAPSPEITEAEAAMLEARHAVNMDYFNGFLDDIESGSGRMPYGRRADLYARSLWSIFTRGETVDWDDPDAKLNRYDWIMDPDSEHCKDCIARAKHSRDNDGYSYDELVIIGWPGEGTICRVNCRCHVRTRAQEVLNPTKEREPAETGKEGTEEFVEMLGGPGLKVKMPASGLPSVGLTPNLLVNLFSSANTVSEVEEMGQLLPTIPNVLIRPAMILPRGNDTKYFVGGGMTLQVDRGTDGRWLLAAMFLGVPLHVGSLIAADGFGGFNLAEFNKSSRLNAWDWSL